MSECGYINDLFSQKDILCVENESLKKHTSFKIGGKCKILAYPKNPKQVLYILNICKNNGIPYFILGRGSNLLVSDSGFEGVVISSKNLNNIKLISDNEIYCESGVNLSKLCSFALENSLSGLEFAFGIPGSVGGAVFMNAGAYGGKMKDIVKNVTHLDNMGHIQKLSEHDLKFSYRHSVYQEQDSFILGAILKLFKSDKSKIRLKMDELLGKRKAKQPLEFPSAGSVFKRPKNGYAAELIEKCGLKGEKIGGAQVSQKHSGFIVNLGGATSDDVNNLIKKIQKVVVKNSGVFLEPEIKYIESK